MRQQFYGFFLRLERCRGTGHGQKTATPESPALFCSPPLPPTFNIEVQLYMPFETSFEILFWEGPAPPTKKRVAMLIAGGGGEGGWIASGVAFFCPSPDY